MKRLYLSGAITNNPNYKKDFEEARIALNKAGYSVVSPIIFCEGLTSWRDCMNKCINILLKQDAVATIETPYQSQGMDIELYLAGQFGMEIKTVDEWVQSKCCEL